MEIAQHESLARRVESLIRIISDFPHPDGRFRDITLVIEEDADLFRAIINRMAELHEAQPPDRIVCIESWGYVFGAPLAYLLGSRIVLARRPGKLPRETIKQDYIMCYAQEKSLEIHRDAINKGDKVLIVDDVIASGGSAFAALKLVEAVGGNCIGIICLAAMTDGPFTKHLEDKKIPIHSIARL